MNFNIHQKCIEKINKTEEKKIIIFSEKKYTKEASVLYKGTGNTQKPWKPLICFFFLKKIYNLND
jgi:hypothetical protein